MQPEGHDVSWPLRHLDGAVVGTELVAAVASGPGADVLAASVQLQTLTLLGRGVQRLAEVEGRHNVKQSVRSVRVVLNTERFGRLQESRANVKAGAILGRDAVGLCKSAGLVPPTHRDRGAFQGGPGGPRCQRCPAVSESGRRGSAQRWLTGRPRRPADRLRRSKFLVGRNMRSLPDDQFGRSRSE